MGTRRALVCNLNHFFFLYYFRFAINRPNRLVGRVNNRPSILNNVPSSDDNTPINDQHLKIDSSSSSAIQSMNSDADVRSSGGNIEPIELQQNGLNRLKSRPRIQINPNPTTIKSKSSSSSPIGGLATRKINPLVARRKLNGKNVTAASSAVSGMCCCV